MKRTSQWLLWSCLTWICLAVPFVQGGRAQTTSTTSIPLFPKYIVLGVVYAPPGSSSAVTYGNSTTVGSSNSITQTSSTQSQVTASTTFGGGLFGWGAKLTTSVSDGWSTSNSGMDSFSVQSTHGNSISTLGPLSSSLGVNHDNDVIYLLLNPMMTDVITYTPSTGAFANSWTGLYSNSCNLSAGNDSPSFYQKLYGCDPNQYPYPDVVGIPVWCLKNPYYPGQGCAQWLPYTSRSWDKSYRGAASSTSAYPTDPTNPPGLTLQDYADILQADPFVQLNGNTQNVCHVAYGVNFDPNDAEVIGTPLNNGTVVATAMLAGGQYSGTPSVTFTGGGGSGATGIANMNPAGTAVVSVTLSNGGSGYQSAPTVGFSGGSPTSPAAAVAYIPASPLICGTSPQVTRFQPYGTVEYPVPGPNGLPSTYKGSFAYSQTTQSQTSTSDSHMVGYAIDLTASTGFPGLGATFSASLGDSHSNTLTWQNSSSTSSSSSYSADYSITGPQLSDNYTGPATYNVYLDNVYGTFAFYSDLSAPVDLGMITISQGTTPATQNALNGTIAAFPSTPVGSLSTTIAVTLTNNSNNPLTMVWPAVTFDNAGFELVQNDANHPDGCSNQYLLPFGQTSGLQTYYCTLYIQFSPQHANAQNVTTNATPAVNATMIAAGTENATSYQNILVTSQQAVTGTVGTKEGALLIAVDSSITASNPIPNIYAYQGTAAPGTTQSETYVLTNNYDVSITPQSFTVADTVDFGIGSGGTCSQGTSVAAGASCTVIVQLHPPSSSTAGAYTTFITVSGTVGSSSSVVALAVAGATGQGAPVSITPVDGYAIGGNCDFYGNCDDGADDIVTITNLTYSNITLSINGSTAACPTLASGASCILDYPGPGMCQPGQCPQTYKTPYSVSVIENGTTYGTSGFTVTYEWGENETCQSNCTVSAIITAPGGSAQSLTAGAGSTAQYAFQVAPSVKAYLGPVFFTATGLPVGATASFSPSTLAANSGAQTVTLSVKTKAATAGLQPPSPGRRLPPITLALLLLPLGALGRSRRKLLRICSLMVLLVALAGGGVTGCGTGTVGGSGGGVSAPQTYTIVVTATSGGASQSANVYLTVQ